MLKNMQKKLKNANKNADPNSENKIFYCHNTQTAEKRNFWKKKQTFVGTGLHLFQSRMEDSIWRTVSSFFEYS